MEQIHHLIAFFINNPQTFVKFAQCCKRFNEIAKSLTKIKKNEFSCLSPSNAFPDGINTHYYSLWLVLPDGRKHGPAIGFRSETALETFLKSHNKTFTGTKDSFVALANFIRELPHPKNAIGEYIVYIYNYKNDMRRGRQIIYTSHIINMAVSIFYLENNQYYKESRHYDGEKLTTLIPFNKDKKRHGIRIDVTGGQTMKRVYKNDKPSICIKVYENNKLLYEQVTIYEFFTHTVYYYDNGRPKARTFYDNEDTIVERFDTKGNTISKYVAENRYVYEF